MKDKNVRLRFITDPAELKQVEALQAEVWGPEDVVPDVNDSMPLVPTVPAFSVRTTTAPDVSAVPSPVVREIAPPVKELLYPAEMSTAPPVSVWDLPTDTSMSPPSPFVALPVASWIIPDPPEDVVPLVKLNAPLTPFWPAFADRTAIPPLVVAVPSPVSNEIAPPL